MTDFSNNKTGSRSKAETESARIRPFIELFTFTDLKQSYWGRFLGFLWRFSCCQKDQRWIVKIGGRARRQTAGKGRD